MSYVKDLGKVRDILEEEVEKLLKSKFSGEPEGVHPIDITYQDPENEMSYGVEVNKDGIYLVLVNSQTGELLYDIEPSCMDIEELAAVADELSKREERTRK